MAKASRSKAEVHTTPNPDGTGWINTRAAAVVSTHHTKHNAVEKGRAIARKDGTEHVIHREDGTIGQKNSYGNDPTTSRDKR
jgi:hypothetical protein